MNSETRLPGFKALPPTSWMVFLSFSFYYFILSLGNGIDNNATYFIPLLRGSDKLTLISIWYMLAIIISYEEPYEVQGC